MEFVELLHPASPTEALADRRVGALDGEDLTVLEKRRQSYNVRVPTDLTIFP